MATRYAVANSTDWGSTNSWSATASGAGGASVPVTGDTVWIQKPVNFNVNTTQTAVSLAALYITQGFTSGTIGTSGTPLRIGVHTGGLTAPLDFSGSGSLFIYAGTDGIDVFSPMAGSQVYVQGGAFTKIFTGQSGLLTINGGTISNLYANGMGVSVSGDLGNLEQHGGNVTVGGTITTAFIDGGLLRVTGAASAITTAVVYRGGTLRLNNGGGFVGDFYGVGIYAYPGSRVDSSGSSFPITIALVERYVGCYLLDNEQVPVTITATNKRGYR